MTTFTDWLMTGKFRRSILGLVFVVTYFNTNSFIMSASLAIVVLWVMYCSYTDSKEDKG